MISEEQLATWERLANDATDGPWLKFEEAQAEYKDYRHSFDWWQIIALNKATKMPFVLCSSNGCLTPQEEIEKSWRTGKEPEGQTKKDIAFIAAAREAVPALIASVRELKAQLPDSVAQGFYHGKTIMEGKVEQLEKEADWLAREHWPHCHKDGQDYDFCNNKEIMPEDCMRCWREAARKATESE